MLTTPPDIDLTCTHACLPHHCVSNQMHTVCWSVPPYCAEAVATLDSLYDRIIAPNRFLQVLEHGMSPLNVFLNFGTARPLLATSFKVRQFLIYTTAKFKDNR